MRTLYLCRHAKSSWADAGQRDHDRPLNERGLRNATFMATLFKERGEPLDLLLTSTALRALTTARYFGTALGAQEVTHFRSEAARPQLLQEARIYEATVQDLLNVVNKLPDEAQRVMLFGHNPGFTQAVEYFSSEPFKNLPTCGIVRIDFPVKHWVEVSRDLGTLVWHDHPKRHPGQG